MIPTRLDPSRPFYRFLTPRWSYLPVSGAGAAAGGGRFNRPGVEALYLSAEPETALAEYQQGSSLVSPGTLAAYHVTANDVVDFSNGFDAEVWAADWTNWATDWRYVARIERRTPETWIIGDALIRAGRRGLLFPSIRRSGGTNLVIFSGNLTSGEGIQVHDPESRLPVDPSSWR